MRPVRPALLAAALAALPALAQPSAVVTFGIDPGKAAPGGEVELKVQVSVPSGWHIYSSTTQNGIPTSLALELPAGLERVGGLREPAPLREETPFVGPTQLHRGAPVFKQTLRVKPGAKGPLTVKAALTWQMCDDKNTRCLNEATTSGSAILEIDDKAPAAQPAADPPGVVKGGDARVQVTARLKPAKARPGESVELVLEASIVKRWHIYATDADEGTGKPTTLTLDPTPGVTPDGRVAAEPAAKDYEVPFVGKTRIHEGKVTFRQRLAIAPGAAQGERKVTGNLVWQPCDESRCDPDGTLTFALALAIEGEPTGSVATPTTASAVEPPSEPPRQAPPSSEPTSLLGLTWASIVLGIVMLLQPCNYPMIPITVSIFSKGRKLPRQQAIARAGTYALGIVVSFVLVAGLLTVILGARGQGTLNSLATNPWVNLGIGALFVYFAFSFFGYYEIGLPGPLARLMQLGAAKRDAEGTVPAWSLFLMGFFFVLTSYTCGAPVVLAVFATAAGTPHPLAILYATFIFACVVATPYFVLSLIPDAVRSLPKSGEWFSVFKAVLGFLELAFALKFLRGADVMWELGVFRREVIYGLWTLLSLAIAVYLLGFLPVHFPHDPKLRPPSRPRVAFAALFLGMAGYFGMGTIGQRLWAPLETFLLVEPEVEEGLKALTAEQLAERAHIPIESARLVIAAKETGMPLKTREDLVALGLTPELADKVLDAARRRVRWGPLTYALDIPALESALARSKETGKPVFVMFTGHNCVNCQLMENAVLPRPEVVAILEKVDRVALFIDKAGDPEEEKHRTLLTDRFANATIPAFYVVDHQQNRLATQVGGTWGPGGVEQATKDFVAFLEKGGLKPSTP